MKHRLPILLLGFWPTLPLACDLPGAERRPLDDGLVVYYRAEPAAPVLSQHFALRFRVCSGRDDAPVSDFEIDASMPAHNHGMNYRPAVTGMDDGSLRVSGMLFHMPGLWRVDVEFENGGRSHKLSIEYPM